MKKMTSMMLVLMMAASLSACGGQGGATTETSAAGHVSVTDAGGASASGTSSGESQISGALSSGESSGTTEGDVTSSAAPVTKFSSALELLSQVWDAFGEDDQFAAAGGDAAHEADGPGKFALTEENKESFEYLLHVSDELYAMLDDDAATLQHMMNTNTFSAAAAKLQDPTQASAFAEAYKREVQNQHWMCGFPDELMVISVGDYVVFGFGIDECIDALKNACATVAPEATVLVDAAAVID